MWDEMKAHVRRAAERELELTMKPGQDLQIAEPSLDVRVEGRYLGWCSQAQGTELRELYEATPSRLHRRPPVQPLDLDEVCSEIGAVLASTRALEADALLVNGTPMSNAALHDVRSRLERLHARVLLAQQNGD